MKKIIFAFSGLGLLLLFSFGKSTDPKKVGAKAAFDCLRKHDSISFQKLFMTYAEFCKIVDAGKWNEEKKTEMKSRVTQHKLDSLIALTYANVRYKFKINWNKVTLDSIATMMDENGELGEQLRWGVFFKEGGKSYELNDFTSLKTPRGWMIADHLNIIEKNSK